MGNGTQLDAWLFLCVFLPIAFIALVKIRQIIVTGAATPKGCLMQAILLIGLLAWAQFLISTFGDANFNP